MRVVFTVQAEQDLEEIGDYIAIENPSRAVLFLREIRERCAKSPPRLQRGIVGSPTKFETSVQGDLLRPVRIGRRAPVSGIKA